jgi:predicted nucleotidyltransferase
VFQDLLKKVAGSLNKRGIPYMVIGGQAVLVYGEPRLTKDIDITLGVGPEALNQIEGITETLGLKPLVKDAEAFVKETMVFPVGEEKSGIRVDFIFSFSEYERQAIARSRGVKFGRTEIKIATLEDVVIHKIVAGRPRDLEDVESILLKNPDYDIRYIEKWLGEFDIALEKDFRAQFRALIDKIGKS